MTAPARKPMFTAFVRRLGIVLEPGQLVLAKVAFDGLDPCDLEGQERELARLIFGPDVDVVPPVARRLLVLVCGGRAGKSYIFIALRMLHLALTVPLDGLAAGEEAAVNITAPGLGLAMHDLNYIRGAIRKVPALLAMAVHGAERDSKSDHIIIRRPDGDVTISCRAASGRGITGRGRSIVAYGMDEGAFFQDANHKVNDRDVYEAQQPRVVLGGQGVIGTTPWAEEGLVWEKFEESWNHPVDCLVAHAPTTLLRSSALILQQVALAFSSPNREHRENAEREFGAKFMTTAATQYFDGETLRLMFTDDDPAPAPPASFVTAGGDLGFTRNSSALAVGWCLGGTYAATRLEERRPGKDEGANRPSVTCKDFARIARAEGAEAIMADGHYSESAKEHFDDEGKEAAGKKPGAAPVYFLAAPADKPATYARLRDLGREGKVRISNKLPLAARLKQQLRSVRSRPLAGGGMSITAAEAADGSHVDIASAVVLWVWQQHGAEVPRDTSALSSAERERERCEAGERAYLERLSRPGERDWLADETEGDDGGLFS